MNQQLMRKPALAALAAALTAPLALAQVGANYCGPAVPNSSGQPARISALGSANLGINANRLTLVAADLPPNQFGFFFTGRFPGFTQNPGGSAGNLCLAGPIGRYTAPGQIQDSGAAGRIELAVDLALTPVGAGFVQVLAGQTWHYQAWFRDVAAGGAPTSNFSDALAVQFSDSCPTCAPLPNMVPIPAGTFRMGSDAPNAAPYFNDGDQQPVHDVTISYSFWMGQYEVTQLEYQTMGLFNDLSGYPGPTRPVERLSWGQARLYCQALTLRNAANIPPGYEYRLPTEAEWEYACRAGTTTEFNTGLELQCSEARFWENRNANENCGLTVLDGTLPVGSFAPNAFGLYDMHGNVWEWCLDTYEPYSAQAVTDPLVTGGDRQVVRGGSWGRFSDRCRSAVRLRRAPNQGSTSGGFRVVLGPIVVVP